MSTTDTSLMPVERALLEILPLEGEMLGFNPMALQVRSILRKPGFEYSNAGDLAGRLKSLQQKGFVVGVTVQPVGRGLGWQATQKGKSLVTTNGKETA